METISFNVIERNKYGTGSAREERRNGLIPAVIYGPGKQNMHLLISQNELIKVKGGLKNKSIVLVKGNESISVLWKASQYHPVKDTVMHIDFMYN